MLLTKRALAIFQRNAKVVSTRMEGILAGIAVCFLSSSEANCTTTVPQTDIQLNGALQHTNLKETRNGDFVTSRRSMLSLW